MSWTSDLVELVIRTPSDAMSGHLLDFPDGDGDDDNPNGETMRVDFFLLFK